MKLGPQPGWVERSFGTARVSLPGDRKPSRSLTVSETRPPSRARPLCGARLPFGTC